MEFSFTPDEKRFREEAREWLAANAPREKRPVRGPQVRTFDLAWQQRKFDGGWAGPHWPKEYGGRDLSIIEQAIWYEECAKSGAPFEGCLSVALNHAGPTVAALGTAEQKLFHLPRILHGDVVWCQGFSEPGAGSDLAGLRTRAEVDGDSLVINGQKIWTSYAQYADFQEMLVRTDSSGKRHSGLTWLICDMRQPGIDIRPIRTMADDEHFCEVFYNDVRVPLTNVVGGVGNGWKVAMSTLSFERGAITISRGAELVNAVEELIRLARESSAPNGDGRAIDDDEVAVRLANLRAEAAALKSINYEIVSTSSQGGDPGAYPVASFLYFSEALRKTRELSMELLGPAALELSETAGGPTRRYLSDRHLSIAGGTVEVRRNIVAERILGLPRSY